MRAELERLVESLRRDEAAAQACWERGSDPYDMGMADGIGGAVNDLARILTRSDWIPVSERLPEAGAVVWCWESSPFGGYHYLARLHLDRWLDLGGEAVFPERWQPIEEPAPYRAEGGE